MTDGFLDELEDTFVDQQTSTHKFVFEQLRALCKDAKMCKLNKSTPVNRLVDRQRKQETVKFNTIDIDSYELPSNPDWIPKDMDDSEVVYYELKVSDKTMEYLTLHCKILKLRLEEYNKSAILHADKILDDIREGSTDAAIKKQQEENDKVAKTNAGNMPLCMEQAIYEQVYPRLYAAVAQNIDTEFNKEFEEMYGEEEKERQKAMKKKAEESKKNPPPSR